MANKRDHDAFGAISGALTAALTSRAKTPSGLLQEAFVGALGGWIGSRIADTVEPATHPDHRSFCHGIALNATAAYYGSGPLLRWRRPTIERFPSAVDGVAQLVSAFAVGAASGHVSHLLLDAPTPRGLPWIG